MMQQEVKPTNSGSEFNLPPDYDALYLEIISRPHMVFANDFIKSFCNEFQINWLPMGYTRYKIHPRSPVTTEIRQAAFIVLRNNVRDYEMILNRILPEEADKLHIYSDYIRRSFDSFNQGYYLPIKDVFLQLVFVVRISVWLYGQGVTLAPSVCAIMLTEVLSQLNKKCSGLIFHLFAIFAMGVIEGYEYQSRFKDDVVLSSLV